MRTLTGWLALLSLAAVNAAAAADAVAAASPEMSTAAARGALPAAKGRLKFKSAGPVCMCGDGLSERDIEQALARSETGAGQDTGAGRIQGSGQEKNLNLGVAK